MIGLDITTLSFTFIALVLAWLVFGNRLFDLIPIARNTLVENMTDGVIVLDLKIGLLISILQRLLYPDMKVLIRSDCRYGKCSKITLMF